MDTVDSLEIEVTPGKAQSWAYCEGFLGEDELIQRARYRAEDLGCHPVSPGTGAFLSAMAAAVSAKAVVEVGTGTGVSGMYITRGMGSDGVLTTIEIDAEHARAAKETFTEAQIPTNRVRLIGGDASTVLPRLTDGAYDMVLIDANKEDLQTYVDQGARLLRSGGAMIIDNALWSDRVANPTQQDAVTSVIRDVCLGLRDDERFVTSLLPVGDGALLAVKR